MRLLSVLMGLVLPASIGAPPMPLDQPVTFAGIEVACTGASLDAREDPRWSSFPLKVELAGEGGRYLGGADLAVFRGKDQLVSLNCGGPWLLLRLAPGRYRVEARIAEQLVASTVLVPVTGQSRVVLRFKGE
jgi:hypothetical protein